MEVRNHDLRQAEPEFTFAAQGPTEVSLTVTDDKKGKNTKTVTIDVGRGTINLDLLWSYPTMIRRMPMCSVRHPRSVPTANTFM